jgi:O-antigen/teichoic acid export membrane protein
VARRAAIKGAAWAALGKWIGFAVTAGAFVATARVLGPEPYGAIAAGWLLLSVPQLLLGKATLEALVQREDLHQSHLDAAFWVAGMPGSCAAT